jgi:hypothetical protein
VHTRLQLENSGYAVADYVAPRPGLALELRFCSAPDSPRCASVAPALSHRAASLPSAISQRGGTKRAFIGLSCDIAPCGPRTTLSSRAPPFVPGTLPVALVIGWMGPADTPLGHSCETSTIPHNVPSVCLSTSIGDVREFWKSKQETEKILGSMHRLNQILICRECCSNIAACSPTSKATDCTSTR